MSDSAPERRPDTRPDWLKRKHSRERDDSLAGCVQAALGKGIIRYTGDDGAEVRFATWDEAKHTADALHRCARYAGLSCSTGKNRIIDLGDGAYALEYGIFPKEEGQVYVLKNYGATPGEWVANGGYDPHMKRPRRPRTAPAASGQAAPAPAPAREFYDARGRRVHFPSGGQKLFDADRILIKFPSGEPIRNDQGKKQQLRQWWTAAPPVQPGESEPPTIAGIARDTAKKLRGWLT
jgi:hypothetical protein